jgi:hypothetical protein
VIASHVSADGSTLLYSTYLGGSSYDQGIGVGLAADGSAYLIGLTRSANFPTTPGAFDRTFDDDNDRGQDAFVSRLSADGTRLLAGTYLGGNDYDDGFGITVGPDGSVYATGEVLSTDFPTTPDAFDTTANGEYDATLSRFSADLSQLLYSTYLGGSGTDGAANSAIGADGSVTLAGVTNSADFPITPGAYDTNQSGGDVFISRLALAPLQLMHVAAIQPVTRRVHDRQVVGASVAIQDAGGAPVGGAQVTLQVTLPGGQTFGRSLITDGTGVTRYILPTQGSGTYVFTVTNVSKSGWTYDPAHNVETSDSITVP